MDKGTQHDTSTDAFEPIELGSAFEETRGGYQEGNEGFIVPNTKL
jgi:hypothetical protein